MTLQYQWITDNTEWQKIMPDWNRLWGQSEGASIYGDADWMTCWLSAFGDVGLNVLLGYDGDELVVGAPFILRQLPWYRGKVRRLEPLGLPFADYPGLLSKDSHQAIQQCIAGLASLGKWDVTQWTRLSPLYRSKSERDWPYEPITERLYIQNESGWDAYLKSRKRSFRDDLKRIENRLSRKGKISYVEITDIAEAQSALDQLFALHRERWRSIGQESQFDDPKICEFYHSLLSQLLPNGKVHLCGLFLDNRPIAYHFGYILNHTLYYYCPTYDVAYSADSPGKLLLKYLVESSFNQGVKTIDLGYDRVGYKTWFSTHQEPLFQVSVFSSGFKSKLYQIQGRLNQYGVLQKITKSKWIQQMMFKSTVAR